MQIIIPMSGVGKRFLDAGYSLPKPLIEVDGKPIIEHVVNLFPGEDNFVFICNRDHIAKTNMESILKRIAPKAKIVTIEPHKKGPVYAVLAAQEFIDDQQEVIVNYCDFSKFWDYNAFLKTVRENKADGGISAYKGFHPHMLHDPNYAFIKEKNNWLLEIKEKEPFTNNKRQEYASDGTYYFSKGFYLKKYFKMVIDKDININGEYYVSLVYNLMFKDNLKTIIFEIENMLQWGTPLDLQEYQKWSDLFKSVADYKISSRIFEDISVMLMAGGGKRFSERGYALPKPLIEVDQKPMFLKAIEYFPKAQKTMFVCLKEHLKNYKLESKIRKVYPDSEIKVIEELTQGQACTCRKALIDQDKDLSIFVGSCDNGMIWDEEKYQSLIDDESIGAIVWTFRKHPALKLNPKMYGWVKVDDKDNVLEVSVKKPISSDYYNDHAIVGCFYFRRVEYFLDSVNNLINKNIRINNEFYIDSCINELIEKNIKVKVFEIKEYIGWGTPDNLGSYNYWKDFFNKCKWHIYSYAG